jgi:hypothetical protein
MDEPDDNSEDKRVSMISWIDRLPLIPLAIIALILAVAPIHATPHLVEKVGMLFQGTLTKPIDIFDLFMHGVPIVLLLIRVIRMGIKRAGTG